MALGYGDYPSVSLADVSPKVLAEYEKNLRDKWEIEFSKSVRTTLLRLLVEIASDASVPPATRISAAMAVLERS